MYSMFYIGIICVSVSVLRITEPSEANMMQACIRTQNHYYGIDSFLLLYHLHGWKNMEHDMSFAHWNYEHTNMGPHYHYSSTHGFTVIMQLWPDHIAMNPNGRAKMARVALALLWGRQIATFPQLPQAVIQKIPEHAKLRVIMA